MKTLITFRLRKDLDADLIGVDVSEKELVELCRNGLRLMLGIKTAPSVTVVQKPIQSSVVESKKATQVTGAAATWTPPVKKGRN